MKFKKILPLIGIISTGFVLSTSSVSAATIYTKGASGISGASTSDFSQGYNGSISADDFSLTLSAGTTIRSVHWRGRLSSNKGPGTYEVDNFTLSIYTDGSPISDTPLHTFAVGSAVNRTDTGLDSNGRDVYDYSANIGEAAGTTYWLSIANDSDVDSDVTTFGDSDGDIWIWNYAAVDDSTPGHQFKSAPSGWSISSAQATFGFSLDNAPVSAVPVPAAVWLMGSALAGLSGFSRRKSTAA